VLPALLPRHRIQQVHGSAAVPPLQLAFDLEQQLREAEEALEVPRDDQVRPDAVDKRLVGLGVVLRPDEGEELALRVAVRAEVERLGLPDPRLGTPNLRREEKALLALRGEPMRCAWRPRWSRTAASRDAVSESWRRTKVAGTQWDWTVSAEAKDRQAMSSFSAAS